MCLGMARSLFILASEARRIIRNAWRPIKIEMTERYIRALQVPPNGNESITKLANAIEIAQHADPRIKYLACALISLFAEQCY